MSARQPPKLPSDHTEDLLDEALDESFPASDPAALVEPGGGITGPENAGERRAPNRQTIEDSVRDGRKS